MLCNFLVPSLQYLKQKNAHENIKELPPKVEYLTV